MNTVGARLSSSISNLSVILQDILTRNDEISIELKQSLSQRLSQSILYLSGTLDESNKVYKTGKSAYEYQEQLITCIKELKTLVKTQKTTIEELSQPKTVSDVGTNTGLPDLLDWKKKCTELQIKHNEMKQLNLALAQDVLKLKDHVKRGKCLIKAQEILINSFKEKKNPERQNSPERQQLFNKNNEICDNSDHNTQISHQSIDQNLKTLTTYSEYQEPKEYPERRRFVIKPKINSHKSNFNPYKDTKNSLIETVESSLDNYIKTLREQHLSHSERIKTQHENTPENFSINSGIDETQELKKVEIWKKSKDDISQFNPNLNHHTLEILSNQESKQGSRVVQQQQTEAIETNFSNDELKKDDDDHDDDDHNGVVEDDDDGLMNDGLREITPFVLGKDTTEASLNKSDEKKVTNQNGEKEEEEENFNSNVKFVEFIKSPKEFNTKLEDDLDTSVVEVESNRLSEIGNNAQREDKTQLSQEDSHSISFEEESPIAEENPGFQIHPAWDSHFLEDRPGESPEDGENESPAEDQSWEPVGLNDDSDINQERYEKSGFSRDLAGENVAFGSEWEGGEVSDSFTMIQNFYDAG